MSSSKSLTFSILLFIALSSTCTDAARFIIRNNCSFTVWAAAIPVGGHRLEPGQTWHIKVANGSGLGRIWPRTQCIFDRTGRGSCLTGDCDGLLHCQGPGQPPNTLVEYTLNQINDLDYFDLSLVDGFNVPVEFNPDLGNCSRGIKCAADINGQCPPELRAVGGCNNPCTVFKTDLYCCKAGKCGTTYLATFFKKMCPDAYSYPMDDTSLFTCPGGTNYRVVFCP